MRPKRRLYDGENAASECSFFVAKQRGKMQSHSVRCRHHTNFTRESSYSCQLVLAIAILSVRLSHGWISQKRYKPRSPNLHRRLPGRLVSETVKISHKFEGGHPERGR